MFFRLRKVISTNISVNFKKGRKPILQPTLQLITKITFSDSTELLPKTVA